MLADKALAKAVWLKPTKTVRKAPGLNAGVTISL